MVINDPKNDKSDELKIPAARLKEIDEQETQLRHERASLLNERPWFTKPNIWLSIFGICVPIVLFGLNYFLSQQKSQITITYSTPRPLVLFTTSVKSKAELLFEGRPVENICRTIVQIKNTGNRTIDREQFKDGPLTFIVSSSEQEVSQKNSNKNIPSVLDVVQTSGAGQQHDVLNIISTRNPAKFTYLPSLLNPGESVDIEIYSSRLSGLALEFQGKLANGDIVIRRNVDESSDAKSEKPNRLLALGIIGLAGSRWLALVLLTVGVFASAFMSVGLFAFGVDSKWIIPNLIIFVTGLFVSLLIIALLILIVLLT